MLIPELKVVLNAIDPIGLDEMDSVSLMNRIDKKYVLSSGRLMELLSSVDGNYKVLEINHSRSFSYSTTYLDTAEYLFYNQHLRGELERNKVRYRSYEATDTTFLEVKKSTNRNRTIKWRIENSLISGNACDSMAVEFINRFVPVNSLLLKPVLTTRFTRITLVGADMNERVTLDYDLSYTDMTGKRHDIPFIAVVELKSECAANHSPVSKVLKDFSVRPAGFSKYCFGASVLCDIPKKNSIKPKILLINKLKNEFDKYSYSGIS